MNPNFLHLLFVSFLLSLSGLWENESTSNKQSYVAPPEITICGNEFDIEQYQLKNSAALFTAVANGRWDQTTTWNQNAIPGPNDAVVIPIGLTVRLNGLCQAKTTRVNGKLANRTSMNDFTLETEWLLVEGAAANLEIGTAATPYTGRGIITLKGVNDNENILGLGDKFIGSFGGGTINIHGKNTIGWTQLGATAAVGSTTITLKEPVDWPANAEIMVTASTIYWEQAEQRTIVSVSPDGRTLTLDSPLTFKHTGIQKSYTRAVDNKTWTADLRAEVGLLTRNITIQGDAAAATSNFGGHIMIHYNGKAYIEGVELYHMGQKSILGRYPFHWHLVKAGGTGQYFKNNSVRNSFNRAITIHGTDNTLVEGNFCYEHIGHGIFLEDGSERFNTIRNNVVLHTMRPVLGEELIPSDNELNQQQNRTPSSYWITNPNNYFSNNVAAGTHGTGYWFAFPQSPMGDSANDPYYNGLEPHKEPLGLFSGNKAHSCANGMDIFDQLNADHSLRTNWGWDNATDHVLENTTFYANLSGIYAGIGVGGPVENVIYRDNIFVENRVGLFLAAYNTVENCVFVAESGEDLYPNHQYIYHTYDGAGRMKNCHMVGYNTANSSFFQAGGAARKHVNHTWEGITTDHGGLINITIPNYSVIRGDNPNVWTEGHYDKDGSISGKPGASIVANHPMMLTGGEFQPPNWNYVSRTDNYFNLSFLTYSIPSGGDFPHVTVARTKAGTPSAGFHHTFDILTIHMMPFIANDSYLYTYSFASLPYTNRVKFFYDDCLFPGDNARVNFEKFGLLPGLNITSSQGALSVHNSHASLYASGNSGYYIHTNGDLFIRPVATGLQQDYTITWNGGAVLPLADTDGDGCGNSFEIAHNRNPNDAVDLAFLFDYDEHQGWTNSNNVINHTLTSGIYKGTAGNADPMFWKTDFNFQASKVQNILVKMRSTANNRPAQLFFGRNDAPGFAATRVSTYQYVGNGDWEVLVIPVGTNPQWINNITSMRFDPTNVSGANFEIDWIVASDGDVDNDGVADNVDNCITFSSSLNFQAPTPVPDGTHQASGRITSNSYVPAGNGTTFESGEVEMTTGFEATPGSNFEARIGCQ